MADRVEQCPVVSDLEQIDDAPGPERLWWSTGVVEMIGCGQSRRDTPLTDHLVVFDVNGCVPVVEAHQEIGDTHGVHIRSRDA